MPQRWDPLAGGGREGGCGVWDSYFVLVLGPLLKDTFCASLAIIIVFFIIQIATLLGWICWVSSMTYALRFPSWDLEWFQLLKILHESGASSSHL
jgi:hypothetical protein